MRIVSIGQINALIGPLLGPHMRQLIAVMRQQHGYTGQAYPNQVARAALNVIPGSAEQPSLDQCPEHFAADALRALGHSVNPDSAQAESKQFQRRLEFHSAV